MEEKYEANQAGTSSSGSTPPPAAYAGESIPAKRSLKTRMWDSFKRDPNATVTKPGAVGADGKVFDVESAARATADSPLSKRLKSRHLQMIAIGGSIGTSLLYRLRLAHF
jgi:yeast amino acid transporter